MKRFHLPGLIFLLLPVLPAFAQVLTIDSITYQRSPEFCRLRFPTEANSYYRIEYAPNPFPGSFTQVRGMLLGSGTMAAWDDTNLAGVTNGYYRVRQIGRAAPLDLDGDGLNDVDELRYPTCLNAMIAVPGEGVADCDNDGLSNQFELGQGTDPTRSNLILREGLVINEVDYDQVGTDTLEFVELHNNSDNTISLTNLSVRFINGANNTQYAAFNLSGTLAAHGYLVIANNAVQVTNTATVIRFADNLLQNGGNTIPSVPDGVVIVDTTTQIVVDALSYEGSITAAVITGIPGTYNLVETSPTPLEDSGATDPLSLIRHANGQDSNNASIDWKLTRTPTPGAPNILTP